MFGYEDDLVKAIRMFLEENGIDPFYAVTVFSLLITLSYWRDFKNWDKKPNWVKRLAGSALIASIFFSIISLLRLVGVVKF